MPCQPPDDLNRALVSGYGALPRLSRVTQAIDLLRVGFLSQLAYREELLSQWLAIVVEVVVFRQLWRALYGVRDAYAGVTLTQALTYITMTVVVTRFFETWLVENVNDEIREGAIALSLARPIAYGYAQFLHVTGEALSGLVLVSMPVGLVLGLALRLPLPVSRGVWLAFLGSLLLGFLTSFFIDYLIALSAFWLTDVGGFYWSKGSIIAILGGTFLPLWVFPRCWRRSSAGCPSAASATRPSRSSLERSRPVAQRCRRWVSNSRGSSSSAC
jgi:ABC-2 type transport system permease protein